LVQVGLGVLLELAEGARGDLLRGVLLVVDLLAPVGAHVALDGGDRAIDVGDGLTLGDLADEHLSLLGEGDDRRGGAGALGGRDDGGLAALEGGDGGGGGAGVDSDDTGRGCLPCGGAAAARWFVRRRGTVPGLPVLRPAAPPAAEAGGKT